MSSRGKLHLGSTPPFAHLTLCGQHIAGRQGLVVDSLDGYGEDACGSCLRMAGVMIPRAGASPRRAIQVKRGGNDGRL